jgi:hypothetical protein
MLTPSKANALVMFWASANQDIMTMFRDICCQPAVVENGTVFNRAIPERLSLTAINAADVQLLLHACYDISLKSSGAREAELAYYVRQVYDEVRVIGADPEPITNFWNARLAAYTRTYVNPPGVLGSDGHLGLGHLAWFQRSVVFLMCTTMGEELAGQFAEWVSHGTWRIPVTWARTLCDVMYDTHVFYQDSGTVAVELQGHMTETGPRYLRAADAFTIICVLLYDPHGLDTLERTIGTTGIAPSFFTDLPSDLRVFIPRDIRGLLRWPSSPTS